ncbi:MAG TPA: 1-acyl-sn-glycerol-3-phosphate acyltransferase [Kineosporiaceae bacterium]|nr:1-acyl-sn-glycerol-3-phosphate acyltransferase [Kineosporiaceae bacterium]
MTDAKVISMDGDRPRQPGARSVLLGADRASGERARRRRTTTPLLGARPTGIDGPETETELGENGSGDNGRGENGLGETAPNASKRAPAKSTASQSAAKNTAATPSPTKRAPAKRAPAKQAPVKQAPAKQGAAKQAPTKEAPAKPAAIKQAPAKQASAQQGPTEPAVIKQARAKQVSAQQGSAEQSPTKQAPAAKGPAKQASVKPAPAKVAPAARKPAKRPAAKLAAAQSPQPPHLAPVGTPERARRVRVVEPGDVADLGPTPEARWPESVEPQIHPDDESLLAGGQHSIAKALLAQAGEALVEALLSRARPAEIEAKVAAVLGFLSRRLTGDYELDDFGFDAEFAEAVPLLLLRPLYRHWFRVEVRGIENLPTTGGALIVANHSGAIPMDALMTSVAVHEEHPERRFLRTLGADLVFQTPFLAGLARRSGATLASNPDAERLLSDGHLVGVWPEGFKGIGKPFTERYKLQRFGRGGFVSAALRTGTPIVPCSIVGAEEIYPIIGNVPSLARLLGLPYLPVTPFFPLLGPLGAIPLPSKWLIEFGEPVHTDEYDRGAAEDPMLVFDLTDQIRQSIQQTLYSLLVQRRSIFF